MLAEIIIDELAVETIIGCLPHERITKQPLTISLSIQYDISHVAQTDNIEDAMNYAIRHYKSPIVDNWGKKAKDHVRLNFTIEKMLDNLEEYFYFKCENSIR